MLVQGHRNPSLLRSCRGSFFKKFFTSCNYVRGKTCGSTTQKLVREIDLARGRTAADKLNELLHVLERLHPPGPARSTLHGFYDITL